MFGCWKSTPEGERLSKPYEEAFARLFRSGIGNDIFEVATIELAHSEREEARAVVDRVLGLLGAVDWGELGRKEFAFAFQLAMPLPEYLVLFRVPEEAAAARQAELHRLLEGIASFAPENLFVAQTTREGAKVSTLRPDGVPIAVSAACKKDVVAIAFGATGVLLDGSLVLVDSQDGSGSIVRDERFIASQSRMPGKPFGQFYFDLSGYLGVIAGLLSFAETQVGNDPAKALVSLGTEVLRELRRMKTVAASERAEGDRSIVDTKLLFEAGEPGFIEKLISAQEPLQGGAIRLAPKDATSFFFTSGVRPLTLYDALAGAVRGLGPHGEEALAKWDAIQQHIGFNLREDLLSWLDGGMGCVTLPGGGICGECVVFLRVSDRDKAKQLLGNLWRPVSGYVRSKGQEIEAADVAGLEDFKELRIPAVPWLRPVVGLPPGLFVIASSADAARRVKASFSGEAPSMADNPRFRALGVPEGPFTDVSYADVEGSLSALAGLLGTVGFVASLLPQERDTRPVIKVGHILTKLSRFLQDLDIAVDYAAWTTYDAGQRELRTTQVTALRIPEPGAAAKEF
jgi:hypothetical protein